MATHLDSKEESGYAVAINGILDGNLGMTNDRGSRVLDDFLTSDDPTARMTRLELALIRCHESMQRWTAELYGMIGNRALGFSDIYVLHTVRMLNGNPDVVALSMFLNRVDSANVQYSLKKLEQQLLVDRISDPETRKKHYRTTEEGRIISDKFAKFRNAILVAELAKNQDWLEESARISSFLDDLRTTMDGCTRLVMDRNILGDDQVKV